VLEHTRFNRDVRRWYCTTRWAYLRQDVLVDAASTCAVCGQVSLALDVDHIRKHDGNPALFWDRENLQALCRVCHPRKTRRGE
jgi:5-methylcytosine-specific restriction endonuclease McrA